MTADHIRQAEARYQKAHTRSERAREQRNATIHQALAEGWSHAQIAEASGLTRSRVGQIALTERNS
jgi:hypothetical protein